MPVPQITITPAGFAALVNDEHTGTKVVKITHIGLTATHFDVNTVGVALPGEHKRLTTFGGKAVAADTLHLNIRDDGPDTYTMRGFGLYLLDGTLFAVYSQATAIMEKAAAATLLLATDIRFSKITATSIEVGDVDFINPPATTTQVGVVRLSTDQEADGGSDQTTALTPRGLFRHINARFGADAPSAFVKTLLGAATAAIFRTTLGIKSAGLRDEGHNNGLNADFLDGEHGSYYLDFRNSTNLPTSWNPTAHTHIIGQVDGLVDALNAKANLSGASFVGEVSASRVTSRSNHFYGGQTYAVLNPVAAGGVCMLRPDGASSTTGELVVATAAITWNGQGIWHGGNFNPASKVNKAGDSLTGTLDFVGSNARVKLFDENKDVANVELVAGINNNADRHGVMVNRNSGGSLGIYARNSTVRLDVGATAGGSTLTGDLTIDGRLKTTGQAFVTGRSIVQEGAISAPFPGGRAAGLDMSSQTGRAQLFAYNYTTGAYSIPIDYNGLDHSFNSRIHAPDVRAYGPIAALLFADRSGGNDWAWYSLEGSARLNLAGSGDKLSVSPGGAVTAAGGFDFGSSRKLKDIDGAMPYGLAEVRRIATLIGRYKPGYNDDGRTRLFFDAEQFAEVMPEAVDLEGAEFEGERVASMKLDQVLPPAYRAIAQLAELVDSLCLQVAALQEGR